MTTMVNDYDIGKCLTSLGIEKRRIILTKVLRQQRHHLELNQFQNEINIFPLEWFNSNNGNDSKFLMKRLRKGEGRCSKKLWSIFLSFYTRMTLLWNKKNIFSLFLFTQRTFWISAASSIFERRDRLRIAQSDCWGI